jgi:hypothetical protein
MWSFSEPPNAPILLQDLHGQTELQFITATGNTLHQFSNYHQVTEDIKHRALVVHMEQIRYRFFATYGYNFYLFTLNMLMLHWFLMANTWAGRLRVSKNKY